MYLLQLDNSKIARRSTLASTTSYVTDLLQSDSRILVTIGIYGWPIGSFMSSVGDAQIIFCIVELSLSFFRAIVGPSGSQTIFRFTALAAAVLLLMLCVATLGVHLAYNSEILESDTFHGTTIPKSVNRLYGSWSIIHFIVGLGLSLIVFQLTHNMKQYIKVTFSNYYIVTALIPFSLRAASSPLQFSITFVQPTTST
jgi:hypothetical protein